MAIFQGLNFGPKINGLVSIDNFVVVWSKLQTAYISKRGKMIKLIHLW